MNVPLQASASPILDKHGFTQVVRIGLSHSYWGDLYHWLLTIPWWGFLGLTVLLYIVINTLFAGAYWLDLEGIKNAQPGSFLDAFFFSIQTMATIGYGAMYPSTPYTNILVTIEAWTGLLGLALVTGLMFARFARPTAKVIFSNHAVVTLYNDMPTLLFRTANQRANQILEAQVSASLLKTETTAEGSIMRRFYDLTLVRSRTPIFALTWTIMHTIDANSPLYELTPTDLAADEAIIIISLTGLDETFSQTVHTRHAYAAQDILWGAKFADIITRLPNGKRAINYHRFHDVNFDNSEIEHKRDATSG